MPLLKFQTIGREKHRFGRVAVLLDVDRKMKKLYLTCEQGKGLNGGYNGRDVQAELLHFRVQLLPSQNQVQVLKVRNVVQKFCRAFCNDNLFARPTFEQLYLRAPL
jgi:hypothetical protein